MQPFFLQCQAIKYNNNNNPANTVLISCSFSSSFTFQCQGLNPVPYLPVLGKFALLLPFNSPQIVFMIFQEVLLLDYPRIGEHKSKQLQDPCLVQNFNYQVIENFAFALHSPARTPQIKCVFSNLHRSAEVKVLEQILKVMLNMSKRTETIGAQFYFITP